MRQLFFCFIALFCLWILYPVMALEDEPFTQKTIEEAELNLQILDMATAPNAIVGGTVNAWALGRKSPSGSL